MDYLDKTYIFGALKEDSGNGYDYTPSSVEKEEQTDLNEAESDSNNDDVLTQASNGFLSGRVLEECNRRNK